MPLTLLRDQTFITAILELSFRNRVQTLLAIVCCPTPKVTAVMFPMAAAFDPMFKTHAIVRQNELHISD